MRYSWYGYYLDGKSAGKTAAVVELTPESLKIKTATGETFDWPLKDVRQTHGFHAKEPVQLAYGDKQSPEIITINNVDFLSNLHALAPDKTRHFHDPAHRRLHVWVAICAALAIVGLGSGLYFRGIPFIAEAASPLVPLKWESGLGQSVLNVLAPDEHRCHDGQTQTALTRITEALTQEEQTGYHFKIYVLSTSQINAIALPGGNIIIFRGLLEMCGSPDEIAGVIAHEIQHITKRHAVKRIIKDSSTGVLISAISGDMTGAMRYSVKIADTMAQLSYSRQDEDEADREGMRMLMAAGFDPRAMISIYKKMQSPASAPGVLTYVSTHPDMQERIAKLTAIAGQEPRTRYRMLYTETDWNRIKANCSKDQTKTVSDRPAHQVSKDSPLK